MVLYDIQYIYIIKEPENLLKIGEQNEYIINYSEQKATTTTNSRQQIVFVYSLNCI